MPFDRAQNGEKRLRSLLTRTAEARTRATPAVCQNEALTLALLRKQWCSANSRDAAASVLGKQWPRLAEGLSRRAVRQAEGGKTRPRGHTRTTPVLTPPRPVRAPD